MRPTLLCLSIMCVAAAATAAPAHGRSDAVTIFEAPRELRSGDAALRAATLDEIRDLGAGWLRVVMYWRDVAPSPEAQAVPQFDERDPAGYDWAVYDRIIRAADARGLKVLLTISGPVPLWATRSRRDHVTRPSATRFGRFAEAAGRRYGAIVDAWAIWNEPNHPKFLRPQWTGYRTPTSGAIYRRLFQRGERGLAAAGIGSVPVLFGETAPRGTGHVVHPLVFLRRAMCLDKRYRRGRGCHRLRADGYAHHPYTTRSGPFFRPPSPEDVTIGSLSRLNRALARAGRAGAVRRGLPLWLTEFGIQSYPDRQVGVPQTQQAEFLALSERLARRNPRVVSFSQYLMRDSDAVVRGATAATTRHPGFESGLRTSTGKLKRAFRGFRVPLVALRGRARTTLWGFVRGSEGVTQVTIEYRNSHRGTWRRLKRDRTDRHGIWTTTTTWRRDRRYRVRWTDGASRVWVGSPTRSYPRAR
ncbi:MAG: hypothetical protein Q8K79_16910 [Solirubrobacteraceae bacterium]|nr:hypothetical protein [Solirubrobacteraceae bacterium]